MSNSSMWVAALAMFAAPVVRFSSAEAASSRSFSSTVFFGFLFAVEAALIAFEEAEAEEADVEEAGAEEAGAEEADAEEVDADDEDEEEEAETDDDDEGWAKAVEADVDDEDEGALIEEEAVDAGGRSTTTPAPIEEEAVDAGGRLTAGCCANSRSHFAGLGRTSGTPSSHVGSAH